MIHGKCFPKKPSSGFVGLFFFILLALLPVKLFSLSFCSLSFRNSARFLLSNAASTNAVRSISTSSTVLSADHRFSLEKMHHRKHKIQRRCTSEKNTVTDDPDDPCHNQTGDHGYHPPDFFPIKNLIVISPECSITDHGQSCKT